ncbi:Carboxylesterase NlhH [Rubripirellula tenax]|uniref:Carboxylesterase NlhH n=1 Tax=Rubripirellula tenax TaxID=2528015 RepID=A0A5C6EBI1_9BACT|nr:alpha/beta hydrolase [Rubripirellula tenax]TWU44539.1 Carboxylesterase NlhH [Rubripirellula tenax]
MVNVQRVGLIGFFAIAFATSNLAQDKSPKSTNFTTDTDILYRVGEGVTDAMNERCRLDVYYPSVEKDFPTIVWFHGGGLKSGNKSIPSELKNQGVAIVAANYRLHPGAKSPEYVEDAAAAVAWTIKNIERFGGSRSRVFVSGHSAGGYLTCMVGLDRHYLAAHDVNADDLAGLIPMSGQAVTHFTVRAERGIGNKQPIVDDMSPLFHVRGDAPPILLISGDRDMEMIGRYEENAYLWRMLKEVGHKDVDLFELEGFNHGEMAKPAHPLMLNFVKRICESQG